MDFKWNTLKEKTPKHKGKYLVIIPNRLCNDFPGKTPCKIELAEWRNVGDTIWLDSSKYYEKQNSEQELNFLNAISNGYEYIEKEGFYQTYCDYIKEDDGYVYERLEFLSNDDAVLWAELPKVPRTFVHPYKVLEKKEKEKQEELDKEKAIIYNNITKITTKKGSANTLYKEIKKQYKEAIGKDIELNSLIYEINDYNLRAASVFTSELDRLLSELQNVPSSEHNIFLFENIDRTLFDEETAAKLKHLLVLYQDVLNGHLDFNRLYGFTSKTYPYNLANPALKYVYSDLIYKVIFTLDRLTKLTKMDAPTNIIGTEKKHLFDYVYMLTCDIKKPAKNFANFYGIKWE